MARYGGGHEDFREEAAKAKQLERQLDELVAKERAFREEVGLTEGATERSTARERVRRAAKAEATSIGRRAEAVEGQEARAISQSTRAIEENARARERMQRVQRQQEVNYSRAFRGGRDPMFGQAAAMGDNPSQYAMRRQLGIGQGRAQRIQEALRGGLRPETGAEANQPLTRTSAAQRGMVQADAELVQAKRAYANSLKRQTATDDERQGLYQQREAAQAKRNAARLELQSAEQEAAARRTNVAAIEREAVRRERVSPGNELIRHPQLYNRQAYAPISQPRAGGPGVVAEGGAVGGRLYGGSTAYDRQANQGAARQAQAANQAANAEQRYAAALTAEERAQHQQVYGQVAQLQGRSAAATERARVATRFQAVELGTASQAMRRHGALTSEFIAAAARGETTMRELGFQAVATAGKFGGWTLAASAIYGAVGAIHQLGQGAIASSSGVNQLQRVISNVDEDSARQSFRDLSGQFNVPIADSADAVYRMGQVFHDQTDAVEAAKAALYSYKTGEVDVATSTQNLIAVVNGFGLSAKDLSSVYDQINQAQNTFGIRIGDTEAGLAKAAGTYRNAGGDLDYLLGLFVAIQKATGRSGQEIGTGISRGVNQIRQQKNIDKLQAQGVTVDPQNFQTTLQSAMEAARRPGADIQQIATGLLGNQYARLIAPVLTDQTRLNEALAKTSPEAAKNSAQKELARTLASVDEQIHKVGVSLQRLGDGLAQAGLGIIPGIFLKALNSSLEVAVGLVDVFNQLPSPIRESVVLLGQAAIALKLLRRFGGTDAIAARIPQLSFLAKPEERLRGLATRGLRDQVGEANTYRENLNRQAFTQRANVEAAQRRARAFDEDYSRREAAGTLPPKFSDERKLYEQRRLALQAEVEAAEQAAASTRARALAARDLAAASERELATLGAVPRGQVRAHLLEQGIALPHGYDTPDPRGARFYSPEGVLTPPSSRGSGRDVTAYMKEVERASGMYDGEARQMNRAQQAIQRRNASIQSWARSERRASGAMRGLAGGGAVSLLAGASNATASAATRAAGVAGRMGTGVSRLGSGLSALAASLGPLDAALIAFIGLEVIGGKLEEAHKNEEKVNEELFHRARSIEDYNKQTEALRSFSQRGRGATTGEVLQGYGELLNPVNAFSGVTGIGGYESPVQRRRREQERAKQTAQTRDNVRRIQEENRRAGRPVPQQFLGEIQKQMDSDAKARAAGIISLAEFDRRMKNHLVEIQTAFDNDNEAARQMALAARRRNMRLEARPTDFYRRFNAASNTDLSQTISNDTALLQRPGRHNDQFRLREMGSAYRYLVRNLRQSNDPKAIQQLIQAQDEYAKALEQTSQAQLDSDLLYARSEGQRAAAYRRAASRTDAGPRNARIQLVQDQRRIAAARQSLRAERVGLRALGGADNADRVQKGLEFLGDAGVPGAKTAAGQIQRLKNAAKRDREKIAKLRKSLKDDEKDIQDAILKAKEDLQKVTDAAYEDRQQGRDINRDLAKSRTTDPSRQAAIDVDYAARQVKDARRTYGTNDRRYKQALTALNTSKQSQAQAIRAGVESSNAILIARASGDPITAARAAVTAARRTLSVLRRTGANQADINSAIAQVITAQIQMEQTLREQARAVSGLKFDIASARAEGNPEAQARIMQAKARDSIAHSRNDQERLQGLLDLVNANNQAEQAAKDREAARYEFLASMTDDPVEQARIERIAARRAIRGTQGADRFRALARYNNARRAETQAKVQAAEEDIDFEMFMGNIDRQTAIDRYQAILKQHGLTKAMRRDVQRRIKELQNESDQEASGFGLDVGSIRMPTIYDVRRAIGPATQAKQAARERVAMNMQNNVQITVTDPKAADAVFNALDRAIGSQLNMALKNAGVA